MYRTGATSLHVYNEEGIFFTTIPYFPPEPTENSTVSADFIYPFYDYESANEISAVSSKIFSFKNLKANWDSYNACPIDEGCIIAGIDFIEHIIKLLSKNDINIEPPFVAPRPDGGIQFEWEESNKYLEIGLSPNSHTYDFLIMDYSIDYELEDETTEENVIISLFKWYIKRT